MTISSAKNLALVLVVGFVILSIISFWVIKNITTKLIMGLVLAGVALGVWYQRDSLRDCARNVQEQVKMGAQGKLTCTFFGTDVEYQRD